MNCKLHTYAVDHPKPVNDNGNLVNPFVDFHACSSSASKSALVSTLCLSIFAVYTKAIYTRSRLAYAAAFLPRSESFQCLFSLQHTQCCSVQECRFRHLGFLPAGPWRLCRTGIRPHARINKFAQIRTNSRHNICGMLRYAHGHLVRCHPLLFRFEFAIIRMVMCRKSHNLRRNKACSTVKRAQGPNIVTPQATQRLGLY